MCPFGALVHSLNVYDASARCKDNSFTTKPVVYANVLKTDQKACVSTALLSLYVPISVETLYVFK